MANLQQSIFLDLKKHYQSFQYIDILDKKQVQHQTLQSFFYQGITLNTYLHVQQKDILIKDLENFAIYFSYKTNSLKFEIDKNIAEKFPAILIRDRICFILQNYQQQPSLLEPLLEQLIKTIFKPLLPQLSQEQIPQLNSYLQPLYSLAKVCSIKSIEKHFPSQVNNFISLYKLLNTKRQLLTWQSLFILLAWMGVLVLMPFKFSVMGIGIQQIIQDISQYMWKSTRVRDSAAIVLSKIFIRHEGRAYLSFWLQKTLQWLKKNIKDLQKINEVGGILNALFRIYKNGNREDLLKWIKEILQIINVEQENYEFLIIQWIKVKLLQCLALTYLKPQVHKRLPNIPLQIKSLFPSQTKVINNTSPITTLVNQNKTTIEEQQDPNRFKDVDWHGLCQIIDILIDHCGKKDTKVREAVAKGLARIANRLQQDMSVDIIHYVLSLPPTSYHIHTTVLTLSEFCRRNLLPPQLITSVQYKYFINQKSIISILKQCLLYQKEDATSLSNAIRDSACYLAWSLIRGYGKNAAVDQWLHQLLIVALFDRQVGCRRAASAVFQEIVGRDKVPHGIEILTEADYFTLGLRANAYLSISLYVANFQLYFNPIVNHLSMSKLKHWDPQIRSLAANSLSLLTAIQPEKFHQILIGLLQMSKSQHLNSKLGSIEGIGQIIIGLAGKAKVDGQETEGLCRRLGKEGKQVLQISQNMKQFKAHYQSIRKIPHKHVYQPLLKDVISIVNLNKLKGKSGQSIRNIMNKLIESVFIAEVDLADEEKEKFLNFLQESFRNPEEFIYKGACKALRAFSSYKKIENQFFNRLISNAKTNQGYFLALSHLNQASYLQHLQQLIEMIQSLYKKEQATTRINCIKLINQLIQQLGINNTNIPQTLLHQMINIVIMGMRDYLVDKRGDVGIFIRQEALLAAVVLVKKDEKKILQKYVKTLLGNMLQQLVEKIDSLRLLSGSLLQQSIKCFCSYDVPHREYLLKLFSNQNIALLISKDQQRLDKLLQTEVIKMEMNIQNEMFGKTDQLKIYYWNQPACVFRVAEELLQLQGYREWVVEGLAVSAGGISQNIVKYSLQAFENYLTNHSPIQIIKMIVQLIKYKNERTIIPLLKVLDFLLEREEVFNVKNQVNWEDVITTIQKAMKKKNVLKLIAVSGVYVNMISLVGKQRLWKHIVDLTCHIFPAVRKAIADKLLLYSMTYQQNELCEFISTNDFQSQQIDLVNIRKVLQSIK